MSLAIPLDAVIERVRTGTITARADGTTHTIAPIAIPTEEGEALSRWVAKEHAATSIETGFSYGVSTLFIFRGLLAGGAPEIRHVAIDPNQAGFSKIALQLVDEAGLRDHLEFYEEPSEMVLPRLLADRRRFDFAFVDGNHRFDWVFVDLIYLGRLLRGGAVIFLDDYQLSSIGKAVAFCVRNLGWSIEEEGTANEHHHWVALRTPLTPLQRDFDFFVDF